MNPNIKYRKIDKKYKLKVIGFTSLDDVTVVSNKQVERYKVGGLDQIADFGHAHKQSGAIWKTMTDGGYANRVQRAYEAVEFEKYAKNPQVVADIGCGPRAGLFFHYTFPTMYAVDPSWSFYNQHRLIKIAQQNVIVVEDYAQLFKLPQPADVVFSLNAINHSGDFEKSIDNMMDNLKPDGVLLLHVHLRSTPAPGHPMPLDEKFVVSILNKYKLLNYKVLPYDPSRQKEVGLGKGHLTFLGQAKRS